MRSETTTTAATLQAGDEMDFDNVHLSFAATAKEKKLTVTVKEKWELSAQTSLFPFATLNPGQVLLDISAKALYDADHDPVAPHGLFGQSFDGDDVAITGKLDPRPIDEMTTEAQAEGAIEGIWRDYMIACNPATSKAGAHCEHATKFKYTRFDKTSAQPRDVTKLSGKKKKRDMTTPTAAADALPPLDS
jgi:hypothetical protein